MSRVTSYVNESLGPLPTSMPQLPTNVLDMFSLKGKVASVTGSSRGIGLSVAEAFCQAGADVAIWYNSKPADEIAADLARKYNVKVKAYKCDITDFDSVKQSIEQQVKDFGTIDVFVANAGVAWTAGGIIEGEENKDHLAWRKQVDTNLDAVYYSAKLIGPLFKKKFEETGKKSSMIITASISGQIVNVPQRQAPYNAVKAATIQFSKSLAVEWSSFARVNSVSPGYIMTELTAEFDPERRNKWLQLIPMGREADPKELWGSYLFLASDASTYATGLDLVVDGGYTLL